MPEIRLVETGTRNRLVHTPRGGKRTRSLPIIGANADSLFESLVRSNRTMRFLAASLERELALEIRSDYEIRGPAADAASVVLQTNLDEQKLEKRLLSIFRDAKTAEEEQGINILFLAIGFLRWYEDDQSEVLREAPLVLVPVALARDRRRSMFELRARDEDITANQAIQERLRADFGVALPDLSEGDDWLPSDYFADVIEAISVKSRWSVDPDGVELGFYSFSKLLMIRDLEPAPWGDKSLVDHPLLRGLLMEGFRDEPLPIADDAPLDELFAPADLVQVVDANSSQTIVIEAVRTGRNIVVQGPPGTGKSQTIANIIAAAVHDGKSVLFVAEKMAALNVVHNRLQKVDLGPICLQLHSGNANKRLVLAEIDETLNHHSVLPDVHSESERLKELRDTLNVVDKRMHTSVGETGTTPFEALSRLIKAGETSHSSDLDLLPEAATWSRAQYVTIVQAARELAEITAVAGPCFEHPYFGVQATMLQPAEFARLAEPLTALAKAAVELATHVEALANYLGLEQVASLSLSELLQAIFQIVGTIPADAAELADAVAMQDLQRIVQVSKVGIAWTDLRANSAETYVDAAWDIPAAPLRLALTSGMSFFGRFKSSYQRASKVLAISSQCHCRDRLSIGSRWSIRSSQSRERTRNWWRKTLKWVPSCPPIGVAQKLTLRRYTTFHAPLSNWGPSLSSFEVDSVIEIARQGLAKEYISGLTRLSEAYTRAADGVLPVLKVNVTETFGVLRYDQIPLRDLAVKAQAWRDSQSRFDDWRRLAAADARLRAQPAIALANGLATGRIQSKAVKAVLDCTFAETVWSKAIAAAPELGQFYGPAHDAVVEKFRGLEAKRRRTAVQIVLGRHAEAMPRGNYGEIDLIRAEIKRKRGHMSIRKLFKTAGRTLQQIKPVLLISPISVAQFLPPTSVEFDLLVIDEASQVRPEDALGLVARVKQMVVVGDNKQLPPTSFFDRVIADEEDADWDNISDAVFGLAAKATELRVSLLFAKREASRAQCYDGTIDHATHHSSKSLMRNSIRG